MAAQRIEVNPTRSRRYTLSGIGDSLVYATTLAIAPEEYWPEVVAGLLRANPSAPALIKARNFGLSGDGSGAFNPNVAATPGNKERVIGSFTQWEVPDIAVIYTGTNDVTASNYLGPGAAPATNGAGTNTVNAGNHDYVMSFVVDGVENFAGPPVTFNVGAINGVKLNPLAIGPTGTTARKIYRSAAGTTTPLKLLTTISDNFTLQYIDLTPDASLGATIGITPTTQMRAGTLTGPWQTTVNIQDAVQFLLNQGCSRIIVKTQNYYNYSSGGDTGTAGGSQNTQARVMRLAQAAVQTQATYTYQGIPARTDGNIFDPTKVVIFDQFTFMANIIAGTAPKLTQYGTVTTGTDWVINGNQVKFQGVTYTVSPNAQTSPAIPGGQGFNWHVADSNVHINAFGHYIVSVGVMQVLQNQGWASIWTT